jgi:hypothetical protein
MVVRGFSLAAAIFPLTKVEQVVNEIETQDYMREAAENETLDSGWGSKPLPLSFELFPTCSSVGRNCRIPFRVELALLFIETGLQITKGPRGSM